MSEQPPRSSGEPGYENEPAPGDVRTGAERRTQPGPPTPGTNQGKSEPAGAGNTSTGTGESPGTTTVGRDQPEDARPPGLGSGAGGAPVAHDVRGPVGSGSSHRQPQRYGNAPEPIATDDQAGARAATPGASGSSVDTTGRDVGATYGLAREAMPGTVETSTEATGVRRAAYEGRLGDVAGSDVPAEKLTAAENARRLGDGPESSAAARGESLQPAVEQTQTGEQEPRAAHERPVTGSHRPAAPSGEVSPT